MREDVSEWPAAKYLRYIRHYHVEPWGNRESGLRTGYLAMVTSDAEGIDPETFIIANPTKAEAKERDEWERQSEEFEAARHKRLSAKGNG